MAWPQRSISPPGVNHRRRQTSPSRAAKAVSERLFSRVMSIISSSGSQLSRMHTAAGFPPNTLSVKASTTYCLITHLLFVMST